MNKSGNNQTGPIRHRAKTATPVDRSNIKRPAASLEQAVSETKTTSSSNSGTIKVKRSSMISHFSDKMPAKTSIGVRVISSDSTTKKTSPAEMPATHPMLVHARAKMQQRRAMSARESAMQQMATKRIAISSSMQPSAGSSTQTTSSKKSMTSSMPSTSRKTMKKSAATSASTAMVTISAKERKDMAIKNALANAERATKTEVKPHKLHFSLGRILIAFGCTAAAMFAIAYFINLNVSDFSLYAAAREAGIESDGREPRVPQEFTISNISSENGKVTINYHNATTDKNMSIAKEKSSWDSNALLTNFVRDASGDTYITVREQGLTIYVSDSEASWVNGGFVYKITAPSGSLTKKQIRQIATSF